MSKQCVIGMHPVAELNQYDADEAEMLDSEDEACGENETGLECAGGSSAKEQEGTESDDELLLTSKSNSKHIQEMQTTYTMK